MNNTRILKLTKLLALSLLLGVMSFNKSAWALTDINGRTTSLEQVTGKGQWSVFSIWDSRCHICHKTVGEIEAFSKRYPQASVYGISTDGLHGRESALAFINKLNLTFPNLLASYHEISDYLYANAGESLRGTPTVMVFNPQGKLTAVQPGVVTADELISFLQKQNP